MAFFTSGDVDAAITTATRTGLVGTATTSGSPFAKLERWARSDVQSALQVAGYSVGDTTTNVTVQRLAIARWCMLAYGTRKGIEIPATIRDDLFRLDQVREGNYPIPGLTPDPEDGIGGAKFSTVDVDATNSAARYFTRAAFKAGF